MRCNPLLRLSYLLLQASVLVAPLDLIRREVNIPAPNAYRSALSRHGLPSNLVPRASPGSSDLQPYEWDAQFMIQAKVGTPSQSLTLILDTGSSDLWVFGPDLPEDQANGHSKYDPNLSSTSQAFSNYTWKVSYGDGSSSNGSVVTDTVTLGGVSSPVQAVEVAKAVSIEFYGNPRGDGIVGFGFSQRNKVKPIAQKTWFDNVKSSLGQGLFTLDLRHNDTSSIDFGFIDSSKYFGSITYLPTSATHQGAWGFRTAGFTIDSQFVDLSVDAIADSGTSLLITNDTVLEKFYSKVPGAVVNSTEGLWVFPCASSVPSFDVHLGNIVITIPPSYLVFGATDYNGSMCYGSLESNAGLSLSIFGITFLKALFVVFDQDNMRLGFASKPLIA